MKTFKDVERILQENKKGLNEKVGGHYGVACQGCPDNQTLSAGEALGARVAGLAKTLCS